MTSADLRSLCAWEPTPLADLGAGQLVAVRVSLPIPEAVLQQLHPAECELVHQRMGADARRWACFVGGRLALRVALRRAAASADALTSPILRLDDGAPGLPGGVAGSISHKRGRAVAVASPHDNVRLGIDLEYIEYVTEEFAARVLTCEEMADVQSLPRDDFSAAVTEIFAVKEAAYKALSVAQRSSLDFSDLRVEGAPFAPARLVRGSFIQIANIPPIKVEIRRNERWVLVVASY
ncbi:4'-phosphopantetheinyl transferase family protein [Sorangium sp. So ce1182]|uniref:4'-phosphopantetheinyl transferase family protein n=1 Tax=Sorangium sp. So ce1182 TaxID=3133334 RepID=UPI003F60D4B7